MFSLWSSAVNGNYLTAMALFLGAGGLELGILGALPNFATMLQLLSAPFVAGLQKRRNFLATFSAIQRFGAALAGLFALWLLPSQWALIIFVALQVIAWGFMGPSTVVWQGYMTDLIPSHVRGRYFATRNSWGAFAGMASVLLYGWVLDKWPGAPGFRWLYYAAFVAAALNYASWFMLPELPQGDTRSNLSFWQTIRIPLAKRGPHQTAAYFFAAWTLAQGLAAPFYPLALQQYLGISFSGISILSTVSAVTSIVTMPYIGRLQDRIGQAKAISLLTAVLPVVPALYLAAKWGGMPLLVVAHLLQGTAAGGLGLANQTLTMHLAPREDRGSYFAFFATVSGIAGFVTPVLAGPLTGTHLPALFIGSTLISAVLCLIWRLRIQSAMQSVIAK